MSLTKQFLVIAAMIMGGAMLALGHLIVAELRSNITSGITATAATIADAMIADELAEIGNERPLSPQSRSSLDRVFAIANDAEAARLLQIRVRNLEGTTLYESYGGITDADNSRALASARRGEVSSNLSYLPLAAVGPLPSSAIAVLKVVTPLHDIETHRVEATAELYYSAKTLLQLQDQMQTRVWIVVAAVGATAIGALYLLVDRTSRTIARQRELLGKHLMQSRRLSTENISLRAASEELRHEANLANERLLSRVGADLHDGPLQLLALLILKLSRTKTKSRGKRKSPDDGSAILLATQAMDELRGLSAGLVLPELYGATLEQALGWAVRRHEELTGSHVETRFVDLPPWAPADVTIGTYRIVREALINAHRHGDERCVPHLTASAGGGDLSIEITNRVGDGQSARTAHRPKLGLHGMRFRAESLGGNLDVDIAGGMARVTVRIPILKQALELPTVTTRVAAPSRSASARPASTSSSD